MLSDAPDTGTQPSISRTANLSDATNSTLTFYYRTPDNVEAGDQVAVEISKDGGATLFCKGMKQPTSF